MKLTGPVNLAKNRAILLDNLAALLVAQAHKAVEERGAFHLALSGGSTPEPFYVNLVIDPRFRGLPWEKTHLWIVDERCVPLDHEQSNWRMIREVLVDHVPLRDRQKHPMPVMDPSAADLYQTQLHAHLPGGRLDFVLLGMGDDAHTASLFPHSPALQETTRWVAPNAGPTVTPPARLTMTYPLLNAARQLAVLVTGARKNPTLCRLETALQTTGENVPRLEYPILGIQPAEGELDWFIDPEAAAGTP